MKLNKLDSSRDPVPLILPCLLWEPTLDIVRVQDVGLRTASDPDILAWAASEGRILLTHDRKESGKLALQMDF